MKNKEIKNLRSGEKKWPRTPIYTYYYFYKFNCHRYSCNKGKVVFVFHVTLQDHVIKSLYDFMIRSPSISIAILASLVAIDTVVGEMYDFSLSRDLA